MKARLIIPAAGMGRRLGLDIPKALAPLAGKPLIAWTAEGMREAPVLAPVVIAVPAGWEKQFEEALSAVETTVQLVAGGSERQASVRRALAALDEDAEIVAIHDAARPFAPISAVIKAIEAAREFGGATLATPASDTLLLDDGEGFLESTPDRTRAWACQTPQVFQVDLIRRAHEQAAREGRVFTDDATLARHAGYKVKLVDGGPGNFKITTARDYSFAAYLLEHDLI